MRWVAATLLALLGLAWALIALSAPGAEVRPAPDDRGFGGLSLLSAALRDAGYRVEFDPSSRPRLGPDDVAVCPVLLREREPFETPEAAVAHARAGGRAVVIGVPDSLQAVGGTQVAKDARGRPAKVDATLGGDLPAVEGDVASATSWSADGEALATLTQVGKGRIARLEDGVLATNRFLGRAENARVVLATIATVARPGDRLVFLAGGYGEAEDVGPVEALGPWAVGALWQSLAVLAAFGISRGVRFGLPEAPPRSRRGSRELLDALAGHYRRGRRTDAPLLAAAKARPNDAEIARIAIRRGVSEDEARRALAALESRGRR